MAPPEAPGKPIEVFNIVDKVGTDKVAPKNAAEIRKSLEQSKLYPDSKIPDGVVEAITTMAQTLANTINTKMEQRSWSYAGIPGDAMVKKYVTDITEKIKECIENLGAAPTDLSNAMAKVNSEMPAANDIDKTMAKEDQKLADQQAKAQKELAALAKAKKEPTIPPNLAEKSVTSESTLSSLVGSVLKARAGMQGNGH